MTGRGTPLDLVRHTSGAARVTNVELFFDLVYVFAVTQLSHHLLHNPTATGALQTALLLAMVWLVWAYTAWVTNWLDPERIPVRLMLIVLVLVALVMWAALPEAFGGRGLIIGIGYAVTQIGRSVFALVALWGGPLRQNFERILAWCAVSGALAVAGGIVAGQARGWLWLAAVGGRPARRRGRLLHPGLGRSTTTEWTIEGNHLAERCQAFILIALGESIVVIGATLSGLLGSGITAAEAVAFLIAVIGSVGLWWLYFDRSAEEGGPGDRRVGRPRPDRPHRLSPHPPGDGGRDHRGGGGRRGRGVPAGCDRDGLDLLAHPGRHRAVHRRARRLQDRRVAGRALVAAGRGGRPGPAGPRGAACPRSGWEHAQPRW